MKLKPADGAELRQLMARAREGSLTRRDEKRLRHLLSYVDSRALTMEREELFHLGFVTGGLMRLLDVVEGRAVIVDV